MIQIKAVTHHPPMIIRWRGAGFTLLELVVVICIASILATVFVERLFYYQERAEKAALELVLARMKMGLQIRMAELIMTRRQREVAALELENPMQWVEEPPSNYIGEYSSVVTPGNWYYAAHEHEMVYVPSRDSYLVIGNSGAKDLRFRVVVPIQADPATGGQTPAGVGIRPVREYKWF
jgi:prepilin-type N-terminal cleavage/methylation domain-containing protein